jgi:hypothetical protein
MLQSTLSFRIEVRCWCSYLLSVAPDSSGKGSRTSLGALLSCVLLTRNSSECDKWWCLPVPRSDSSSGSKAPVRNAILWRWDRPHSFYPFSWLVVHSRRMSDSSEKGVLHRRWKSQKSPCRVLNAGSDEVILLKGHRR